MTKTARTIMNSISKFLILQHYTYYGDKLYEPLKNNGLGKLQFMKLVLFFF